MNIFQVSARKYRPTNFDTLVGQEHIVTTLRNAISNSQLAHAYLFCGPRGVGKTSCARILAKTINCEKLDQNCNPCGVCDSCVAFAKQTSWNSFELDAASNNGVEDIRRINDQVRNFPQVGKYNVFIIDEVHMLSTTAFNAFLKTLEEPPAHVIFILATTEKQKILPTILSRCQVFDFKRILGRDMVNYLSTIAEKREVQFEAEALQLIAEKSDGCMRDALSLFDKVASFSGNKLSYEQALEHLNILDVNYYFQFIQYFRNQDLPAALNAFDDIYQKGFEGDIFISGLSELARNLLIAKYPQSIQLLELLERFKSQYQTLAGELSEEFLVSLLSILAQAEQQYKDAKDKRIFVELLIIKLCYLNSALSASELLSEEKKKP